jgi:XTP/dITP diphosphohydrolase
VKKLIIASNNAGKLREFSHMLQPLGIEVVTQSQLGISEAEEPHVTFIENALAKARHVSRLSGLPALADDSGICVEVLGGMPGVISARYAGENPKSDQRNNEKRRVRLIGALIIIACWCWCGMRMIRSPSSPRGNGTVKLRTRNEARAVSVTTRCSGCRNGIR